MNIIMFQVYVVNTHWVLLVFYLTCLFLLYSNSVGISRNGMSLKDANRIVSFTFGLIALVPLYANTYSNV